MLFLKAKLFKVMTNLLKPKTEEFDVKVNNLYIFNVIKSKMCRGMGAKNTIFVILRARVKICFKIFIGCCEV